VFSVERPSSLFECMNAERPAGGLTGRSAGLCPVGRVSVIAARATSFPRVVSHSPNPGRHECQRDPHAQLARREQHVQRRIRAD
jgi:hypothetical protein